MKKELNNLENKILKENSKPSTVSNQILSEKELLDFSICNDKNPIKTPFDDF
jgi:hypothetical protein